MFLIYNKKLFCLYLTDKIQLWFKKIFLKLRRLEIDSLEFKDTPPLKMNALIDLILYSSSALQNIHWIYTVRTTDDDDLYTVDDLSQQIFTCSNSAIEALEKGMNYVQS